MADRSKRTSVPSWKLKAGNLDKEQKEMQQKEIMAKRAEKKALKESKQSARDLGDSAKRAMLNCSANKENQG